MRSPKALKGNLSQVVRLVAVVWTALFWIGCVAIPVGTLMIRAQNGSTLFDPIVLHIAFITAAQALASAMISALVALPLGLWIGTGSARGRRWAQAILALPFGVPSVVAGLAWILLLGRTGVFSGLDWAYSFKAVILAHVVFNIPWIAVWTARARAYVPENLVEASETLGAGSFARFRYVIWPEIRWAFLSAGSQTFIFCAMSFALITVLGGGPPVQTLETALYSHIRYGTVDLSKAVACALWEFVVTLLPWCLVVYFQSRENRRKGGMRVARWKTSSFGIFRIAIAALFFLPYLAVLGQGSGHFLQGDLVIEVLSAMKISAILAGSTAVGALLTAWAAVVAVDSISHQRKMLRAAATFLMGLPSGISALVLGLGIWLAYGKWIDPFSGSLTAMIALQVAIFFPIAFRVLWPLARDRQTRLLEAATTLGATPARAFWVIEWPRWKPVLLSSLGMVAGASLGEVAAVSLFYSENLIPLPLLISRWSGQYRFAEAQAVAVLLLFLCSGAILLAYFPKEEKSENAWS